MKYGLIRQLIDYAEAYERETAQTGGAAEATDSEMVYFLAWLNERVAAEKQVDQAADGPVQSVSGAAPDTLIGKLVTYLYRYARSLTKRALNDTPLVSSDDFAYMISLMYKPLQTKVELIQYNIHEKTTGMEIIRRLIANGLVEQQNDETDKRSKRLKLTDAGVAMLHQIWPRMVQTSILIGGPLSNTEKLQLVGLMERLHQFHNPIFLSDRSESTEELVRELQKK